eukprot:TRINITY_DN415_c0_g10_i2.p1 TRINITY_DN415_c0_g10~~TRINITY_DN415_c0_g10_i2.p1  ORF type:complete len:310 (-),score=50.05 TRINITY_DN415_c0_g10_i2:516-1445(-)
MMKRDKARELSISSLEADYAFLRDNKKLSSEGIMLYPLSNANNGCVSFALNELALKAIFKTERGNLVQRATPKSVILSTIDQTAKRVIVIDDISETESFEEEFKLFSDAGRLLREGALVRTVDQTREEGIVIYRFSDVPLNVPYLTEKKNVFIRVSETTVQFGHKVFDISMNFETIATEISKIIDDFTAPKKKKAALPVVVAPKNDSLDVSFLNTIKFESLLKILGGKYVKRTIVLTKTALKITRKDSVLVQENHGAFAVLADVEDVRQFTLVIKKKSYHFLAPSERQRDDVLSAIRAFGENAKKHVRD